jgi:hypothetical protein
MCNKSESIKNLAISLVQFNSEVSKVSKNAENPFFKNNYATLDNIIDEVRPILTKHGLSILQIPGGDGQNVVMKTMLMHESGEWIESDPLIMKPVKNDPQGVGSCVTYARRYSLAAFLSLNTGEDDDGNGSSQQNTSQPSAQGYRQQEQTATRPPASQSAPQDGPILISDKQVGYAHKLKADKNISDDEFKRIIAEHSEGNTSIRELTKVQATKFINALNNYGG